MAYDLFIIGGGINGTGIAANAAGRGLQVMLCEQHDLGSATSSSSSKLIHGGLRYLEHCDFRLVREALAERETLLKIAPHLVRPLRFTLPHLPHLRPGWMIRSGLFLYDHLAPRATLPATRQIQFEGKGPLKAEIEKGYRYSDCWVDDARLVIMNAQAARNHRARIARDTRCIDARRMTEQAQWELTVEHTVTGIEETVYAKALVNATGPWVTRMFEHTHTQPSPHQIRLIKGSHIVVPKWMDGDEAYILQNTDKRVVFVLPFEDHFSLIGTTDKEFTGDPSTAHIDEDEITYLLEVVNRHFIHQIQASDIVHTYSGVRPLLDDESGDPSAITRDYTLVRQGNAGEAPLLSVFGGKITTYRKLAETAVEQLHDVFPGLKASSTATTPLPGATRYLTTLPALTDCLETLYPQMSAPYIQRLARSYGISAVHFLGSKQSQEELGQWFGDTLYEAEVRYLIAREWARTAEDILWRRSKLGLKLSETQVSRLHYWLDNHFATTNTGMGANDRTKKGPETPALK